MRVTVIPIDFSPRKSPERAIGRITLSLFSSRFLLPSLFLSVSLFLSLHRRRMPARTNRIGGEFEKVRASLPYVVHGKRQENLRFPTIRAYRICMIDALPEREETRERMERRERERERHTIIVDGSTNGSPPICPDARTY